MPYPIVVANGRTPHTLIINENSTVFEISPYELGSWDPSLRSFVMLNILVQQLVMETPIILTFVLRIMIMPGL